MLLPSRKGEVLVLHGSGGFRGSARMGGDYRGLKSVAGHCDLCVVGRAGGVDGFEPSATPVFRMSEISSMSQLIPGRVRG